MTPTPKPTPPEQLEGIAWSDVEMAEFQQLVDMAGSRDQIDRITARLDTPKFVAKHGKAKADAMFAWICDNVPADPADRDDE